MKFYKRKMKIYYERRNVDYDFIVKVAQACMGGGQQEGQVGFDSGEGIDEMTDEQEANLRLMLGDAEFNRMYGN